MKLLIVAQAIDKNDPNLGAFYYWFSSLAHACEKVTLLTYGGDGGKEEEGIISVSFAQLGPFRRVRTLWRFWELFSREYALADAVLFHQIPEYVVAASPFLIGSRKVRALWYAHKSVTRALHLSEKIVDYILTSSPEGFRLPSKKVHFIGQAIHTDLFVPKQRVQKKQNKSVSLVSVGRIAPIKHYEVMIKACSFLARTWDRPWTLSLFGAPIMPRDYEYERALKELITENGLEKQVHLKGALPYSQIPEVLQSADLFLNTSRTGSLDKAVLEAMSAGLNVLSGNEAYRTILPERYFLAHPSAEFLAERIKLTADDPFPNTNLREIVLREHALSKTIEKIIHVLTA